MREILGEAKTVRKLLDGAKYSIDYYQREYKWHEKQLRELVDDLVGKFLEEHEQSHERSKVADYPHYFLGSIIISKKNKNFVVDGQQRLTSLTLLLLLLRRLMKGGEEPGKVDGLIMSEMYGKKSFNISADRDDDDREACMSALWEDRSFDASGASDSVRNIYNRFQDLEEIFPTDLRGASLPYFVDWLLHNVHLVEITAYSDDDAYTIFETMNDRGLSLSPTDMLKGYLLANVEDPVQRDKADRLWRDRIRALADEGKEVDSDFFKAWFRSQYATKIRERKKGARPEDFDLIGTEFHRWLRGANQSNELKPVNDFYEFIRQDLQFYSHCYLEMIHASREPADGLEHVMFNAQHRFTLQYMLLIAPLSPDDDAATARRKVRLVARYIDILLAWRLWNFRSIDYSTMQYAMFLVMRDIRGMDLPTLAGHLHKSLMSESETFISNDRLRVHQQNRKALHEMLARMTDYVETRSGFQSRYAEYANTGNVRYEVEHIWANHPERHADEFDHPTDFAEHRNRIGGLLLLPKSFNASYGDRTYEEKLLHYHSHNLLARSLNPQCYELNPGFLAFVASSGLPFRPHAHFKREDLDERCELYRQIAQQVWDPADILRDAGA